MRVEAENKELVLKNSYGDVVIFPRKQRRNVLVALRNKDYARLDEIASKLPSKASYAQGGSVVEGDKTNMLKGVTVYGKTNYKKALADYNNKVKDYQQQLTTRDSLQKARQKLIDSYSKYEKADSTLRSRYVDATKQAASEVWYAGGNTTPADTSKTTLSSEYGTYDDLIDDTAVRPRKGWYKEKGVQDALNGNNPFIISDYYDEPEYFAMGTNPGALKDIVNDPDLAERLRFATLTNSHGALSSVAIPILDMPDKPELPEIPKEPVKPIQPRYDSTYEDISMKPVWATQVKQSKTPDSEIIGSYAGSADNKFKHGFTYKEALTFPDEVKKQWGIREFGQGGIIKAQDGLVVEGDNPFAETVETMKKDPAIQQLVQERNFAKQAELRGEIKSDDRNALQRGVDATVNTFKEAVPESFRNVLPGVSDIDDVAYFAESASKGDALGMGMASIGLLPFIKGKYIRKEAGEAISSVIDKFVDGAALSKLDKKILAKTYNQKLKYADKRGVDLVNSFSFNESFLKRKSDLSKKGSKATSLSYKIDDDFKEVYTKKKTLEGDLVYDSNLPLEFDRHLGFVTFLQHKGLLGEAVSNPNKFLNDAELVDEFVESYTTGARGVYIDRNLTASEKTKITKEALTIGGDGRLGPGSYHSNSELTLERFSTPPDAKFVGFQAKTKLNLPGMENAKTPKEKLDIIKKNIRHTKEREFKDVYTNHSDKRKRFERFQEITSKRRDEAIGLPDEAIAFEQRYDGLNFAERRVRKDAALENPDLVTAEIIKIIDTFDPNIADKYGKYGLKEAVSDPSKWFIYNDHIVEDMYREVKELALLNIPKGPKLTALTNYSKRIENLEKRSKKIKASMDSNTRTSKELDKSIEELWHEAARLARERKAAFKRLKKNIGVATGITGAAAVALYIQNKNINKTIEKRRKEYSKRKRNEKQTIKKR